MTAVVEAPPLVPDDNAPLDIRVAAQQCIDLGWTLVRLQPGAKKPISEKGWQNAVPTADSFRDGENIGVQLGKKSGGLVDVDLDSPEARALSGEPWALVDLPSFGRQSLPTPGHRMAICVDAPDKVIQFVFKKPTEADASAALGFEKPVLELRCGRGYTGVPPSIYGDDPLVWNGTDNKLPRLEWADLERRVALLAFAAVAARAYPGQGSRDDYCLHLGGALTDIGVDPETADDIIVAVAKFAGDEEAAKRRGKAAQSAAKRADGEAVTGLHGFLGVAGLEDLEKTIRKWLHLEPARAAIPEGAIEVGRPHVSEFIDEVQATALAKLPDQIFLRNGLLVRLRTLETPQSDEGIKRPAGVVEITTIDAPWLAENLDRAGVNFFKGGEKPRHVQPPREDLGLLLLNAEARQFPQLRSISRTPTLSRSEPGFDPASGQFLAFPGDLFPPIPAKPTRDQALVALQRLAHPLRGFPFDGLVGEDLGKPTPSRSVALSAMLSGVIRGEMSTCPLHGFSAPTPGTGKSLLVSAIGALVIGVTPSILTFTHNVEEMEKRLTSVLRTGDQAILIDNVHGGLSGAFLAAILTAETAKARILGITEHVMIDTHTLVMANGNNLSLRGEMGRRGVVCRIDSRMEHPEEQEFDFDPLEDVLADRAALVADALTVLRGYVAAGRPPMGLKDLGSFKDWSLVRRALVWLGEADPLITQGAVREDDEEGEMLDAVLEALHERFKGEPFLIRDCEGERGWELRQKIQAYLPKGEWTNRAAGVLLRDIRDRPRGGLQLTSEEDSHTKKRRWKVLKLGEGVQDDIPF